MSSDKIRETVGKVVAEVLCRDPEGIAGGIPLCQYGASVHDVNSILNKLEMVYKVKFDHTDRRESVTVGQIVISIKNGRREERRKRA